VSALVGLFCLKGDVLLFVLLNNPDSAFNDGSIMEVAVEYSDTLISATTRRLLLRSFGWKRLVLVVAIVLADLYLLSFGNHDWVFGVAITCLIILIVVLPTRYIMAYYRSMSVFQEPSLRTATFTFTEEGLSVKTGLGISTLNWSAIKKIRRFPEAWLFFLTDRQYFILPIQQVNETTQQFILDKVGGHSRN
jgi:hypothetical protein